MSMHKWLFRKVVVFLLVFLVLVSTSFDGKLKLGEKVWAGPLSPENAITFTVDLNVVSQVLLIDNVHYVIGQDTGGNLGIYRLDINSKALTRVCNVSSFIPGSNLFVGYSKVGVEHRFVFATESGVTYNKYTKVSTISSSNMESFALTKLNSLSLPSNYSCGIAFSKSDGYYYLDTMCNMARETQDGAWENRYRLYKSTDCVNWTPVGTDIISQGTIYAYVYTSPIVGLSNEGVVVTRGYWYDADSSSGYTYRSFDTYLYKIYNNSVTNIGSEQIYVQRDARGQPYRLHSNGEYTIDSYGKFSFVKENRVYLPQSNSSSTSPEYTRIYLYYGTNDYYCGEAHLISPGSSLIYNDNGRYTNKLGTHGKYLYYIYTPSPAQPAGTYKINAITGGTSMTDNNILSMTDYSDSTSFSTPTAIYLRITHTSGEITYHKLQNGSAVTITEVEYYSVEATLPVQPPVAEYSQQGYSMLYADSVKAIFFNSSQHAFKITYKNSAPAVTVTTPAQEGIFGTKDTAVIPQISVSDAEGNALTCKYYVDGIEKETKAIAGNTITPQAVSFAALNMGTLSDGTHRMRFEVSDGSLTVTATADFTVDKTVPVIAGLNAETTENSMTITSGATDAVAGLDPLPYSYTLTEGVTTRPSGWIDASTHLFDSLQPNRSYTVKLEVRDKVGNIAQNSVTAYTKAQRPTIAVNNASTTAIDIAVSEGNPTNTQYQIMAGARYISSGGALTDTPQWVTLTNKRIRVTGLTPNTSYAITAKARNGANEETTASEAVNGMTLPMAPENIAAQPDKYFITLTWSAMPNIASYEVSKDGTTENVGAETTYIHNDLIPNTQHNYKVRAINQGGAGEWSDTLPVYTLPDPPGIPGNLRAEALQNEITLAWDEVAGAISYDIEADGTITENITNTTYTHTGLTPNTPHTYRARARNRGGVGEWSDLLNKDTLPIPPGIPEGLQIKEKTKDTITLTWNSSERAEGYDIEADGAIIGSTTELIYTHTGLAADKEYTYKIRAKNRGGESEWTAVLTTKTLPEKPSIPNNLTATAGTKEITISWDNAERAAEYDVEADGALIATITGTSYTHTGLEPDTKHTYMIKARNTGGESDYSTLVTAYTLTETTGMALTNVAAVVTNTSITLMWDAIAADTEYDLEVDGEIKDNGKNTIYIHGGLQPVTSHTYKVRPRIGEEAGPWCAVLVISTLPNPPDAPNNIRAIVTNSTIQLMWDAEAGATGYDIEVDGTKVESTTDTTYIHKELTPGTQHSYRIRAMNIAGTTPWSEAIVKSTIKPTYMIEAKAGEEYHIALTAMGLQEFKGRKLVLKYNPAEVEILDLCEETRAIEMESGKVLGTNMMINHAGGRIEIEVDKMIDAGKAWTGVMDTILIRSKVDGTVSIDYLVE